MDNKYLSQEESEKIINKIIKEGDLNRVQTVMENILYSNNNFIYEKDGQDYLLSKNLDAQYMERKFRQFSEAFLTKNIIDIELLKDVVAIQNGFKPQLIKHESVENYIRNDYMVLKDSHSDRISFLKQIKFFEESGIIDEENTPLLSSLKLKTEYNDIKLTDEEKYQFSLKKVINNKFENSGLVEQKKIEEDEKYIDEQRAKIEKSRQEYWNKKFKDALLEMNCTEMIFKDTDKPRKESDNVLLDKFYEMSYNMKQKGRSFIEDSSIVKMDNTYGMPLRTFYKIEKNNKGVYFNDLPALLQDENMKNILKLTALNVRAQGIENPFIYTSKILNTQDALQKKAYVEAQMRALLDHAEYSFDNIKVQQQHADVYERLLNEYASKKIGVLDIDKTIEGLKDNSTSKLDRRVLLNYLADNGFAPLPTEEHKDFLSQNNIVAEEYVAMLKKIKDKSDSLTDKEFDNLSLVIDYIKTIGNNLTEDITNDTIGDKIKENLENDISSKPPIFTKHEIAFIEKPEQIRKFNDYEDKKQGAGLNPDYKMLENLWEKIKSPEMKNVVDSVPPNTIELIEKKGMLIDLYKMPQIDPNLKKQFANFLNQNINPNNLNGQEQSLFELGNAIREHNLIDIANYMIKKGINHDALGEMNLDKKLPLFEHEDPEEMYFINKENNPFDYDNEVPVLPNTNTNTTSNQLAGATRVKKNK